MVNSMSFPKCFLSYSWDSDDHKDWVRNLATVLQKNGVKVFLDQWQTYPGIDLPLFMEKSVRESDYVLLICTPRFAKKANSNTGGVGYEKIIVTGEIFEGTKSPKKFIPILRGGKPEDSLPSYLKSKLYIDFRIDNSFKISLEKLLRHLHEAPEYTPPPVGPPPSFKNEKQLPSTKKQSDGIGKSLFSKLYCSRCGTNPGGNKTTCLGGYSSHNFVPLNKPVYCSRCGLKPGDPKTICLGGYSAHNFVPESGAVYCSRCGTTPDDPKTTCSGGYSAHNYVKLA